MISFCYLVQFDRYYWLEIDMKFMLWLLALSSYTITAHCSLTTIVANPGGIGGIYKGPDSETIVHGPDGSVITSQQKGGTIQKLEPIIVAEPQILEVGTPILEAGNPILEVGTPIGLSSTPLPPVEPVITGTLVPSVGTVPVDIVEQDPHIIETEIIDAPTIESKEYSNLVGPSGSITTRGSESVVSGPASTTITKPAKILVAAPVISAVPIIASISTPIRTPFVQVNNELPLNRVSIASPISSTISPPAIPTIPIVQSNDPRRLSLDNVGRLGSTIAPPAIPLVQTNDQRIISLDNIGLGASLAPPRLNTNDQRIISLDNIGLGASLAPPRLNTNDPRIISLDNVGFGATVSPPSISLLQTNDPRRISLDNVGLSSPAIPLLQTNDPRIVSLDNVGLRSTIAPPRLNTNDPIQHLDNIGSTIAPPRSNPPLSVHPSPDQRALDIDDVRQGFVQNNLHQRPVLLTGEQYDQNSGPINVLTGEQFGSVSTTNGVNVVDEGTNGFVQPHSTVATTPRGNVQNIPQEWLYNRQLVVDPSQIAQRNIVPPEIGPIDLVPNAPGLVSPNIEQNFQNGYYQNEIIVGNANGINPVQTKSDIGIAPTGLLGSELNRAGVDSSRIQLTNVPLTDVTGIARDYDDRVSASLWNRYGRKRRNRKY